MWRGEQEIFFAPLPLLPFPFPPLFNSQIKKIGFSSSSFPPILQATYIPYMGGVSSEMKRFLPPSPPPPLPFFSFLYIDFFLLLLLLIPPRPSAPPSRRKGKGTVVITLRGGERERGKATMILFFSTGVLSFSGVQSERKTNKREGGVSS